MTSRDDLKTDFMRPVVKKDRVFFDMLHDAIYEHVVYGGESVGTKADREEAVKKSLQRFDQMRTLLLKEVAKTLGENIPEIAKERGTQAEVLAAEQEKESEGGSEDESEDDD